MNRHNGEGSGQEHIESELWKAKDELKSVQTEREQVQREYKDVKQQLDELTVQANSKLSDQRSKIKVSKRRSMLRCATSDGQTRFITSMYSPQNIPNKYDLFYLTAA